MCKTLITGMPIDISVIMATKGGPTKDELMIIICSITLFIEKNVTLKKNP